MRQKLNVGLMVTKSGRWPQELPDKRLAAYSAWMQENLSDMNLVIPDHVLTTPQEAMEAIDLFKANLVDVVVMVYGAFTADDIAAALKQRMDVPLILWAPHEPPFHPDERLWANALCAMTMNASALHRMGYSYHTIYGDPEEDVAGGEVIRLLKGYALKKALNGMCIGTFGYRPTNYYVSTFDEVAIRHTFGMTMNSTDLALVKLEMDALPEEEIQADMDYVSKTWDTSRLPEGHLELHSRSYLAIKKIMKEQGYDFASIKCWPEMTTMHIQPCAVLGRLLGDGINVACEGDVDAGITQEMLYQLTGKKPFIADMIDMDEGENSLTFWHCGNAAPELHSDKYACGLCNHPLIGQGSAFWTALKPGRVTIARLHNDNGTYKLVLMKGEALDKDRTTRGCMCFVKMDTPVRAATQALLDQGIPHHYVVVWDDCYAEMKQAAQLMNIPVIEL